MRSDEAAAAFIPVMRPRLPAAERLLPYLRRVDQTRIYSNHGPLSAELEQRLAETMRLPPGGVACASSGTAALVGAILAAAGRATPARPLALMPAYTFVATAVAAEQCGYLAYLADVRADTWQLDAERLLTHPERDRFGVVVPVAPFGRPVPQEPWQRFARHTGIPVVIDGAASLEAICGAPNDYLGGVPVALSFHATKTFATGEGGAVATSDTAFIERVVRASNFGFLGSRDAQSASLNAKMSEYHAAVGLAELDEWPAKQAAFRAAADRYRGVLGNAGAARFHGAPEVAGCYALYRCEDEAEAARTSLQLERDGIDFRLWYGAGLHRQSYFAKLPRDPLPETDALAPCLLGLPTAPDLAPEAIGRIAACLTWTS